jgi:glycerol-3-phosphate dehydrogenase
MGRLGPLTSGQFDLAIIGGGIIGCGIARDAALRGLRVALVDKADFGSGTTSASTRIVHGGLRYLEMLDFRLVRLDLRERETLLRIAPHLVKPLEFLIPFFKRAKATALKMRVGLALYDALSYDKSLPSRRWLTSAAARAADPALARTAATGAAAYHDARVDSPERLALENVLDAERHHGVALNYCEVRSITPRDGASILRVRDVTTPGGADEGEINARVVVNATGAWLELVGETLTGQRPGVIRLTKGVHLVCRPVTEHALVLFSPIDRRLFFAIPRAGLTWIGTTDTDFSGDPAMARAERSDVDYLLRSVQHVFPSLSRGDVLHTTAGVRALVKAGGSESSVSRMHRIAAGPPAGPAGVISVLGGKITGYRAIAEDVTDAVCEQLGARDRRCSTADRPLPGGAPAPATSVALPQRPEAQAALADLYGSRLDELAALVGADPQLGAPLSPRYHDIGAQVVLAVRAEHCVHLSDFMRRRTLLGATADQGWDAAARAAALMRAELGWSAGREAEELAAYRREIEWRLPPP